RRTNDGMKRACHGADLSACGGLIHALIAQFAGTTDEHGQSARRQRGSTECCDAPDAHFLIPWNSQEVIIPDAGGARLFLPAAHAVAGPSLDDPRRFTQLLEAACDPVILDYYLLGDGSHGQRTKQIDCRCFPISMDM